MKKVLLLVFAVCLLASYMCHAQGCCSGGSGSPIAGGASAGVLLDRQMEISSNFQYIRSNKFFTEDRDTAKLFEDYNSRYVYSKIAYGITKDLTVSVEAGYFLNKTQLSLFDSSVNKYNKIESSGIADLIIFPRYDIYNHTEEKKRVELTLGLGYKIPLGKHNDSMLVFTNPTTGQQIYTTSPPLVQPTTGSQDIIFYAFFFRGFPLHKFRMFANTLYIRKGWNSLGEKFGDYSSVGLFAGKTFFENLGVTLQLKGEHIGKLKAAENVDLLAMYNVDTASTGNEKIMFVPQLSYSWKSFTFFALKEFPLYEYVNGVQVGTQTLFTAGVSYRFFTARSKIPSSYNGDVYCCPMKCEGMEFTKEGKCPICGMVLEKKK